MASDPDFDEQFLVDREERLRALNAEIDRNAETIMEASTAFHETYDIYDDDVPPPPADQPRKASINTKQNTSSIRAEKAAIAERRAMIAAGLLPPESDTTYQRSSSRPQSRSEHSERPPSRSKYNTESTVGNTILPSTPQSAGKPTHQTPQRRNSSSNHASTSEVLAPEIDPSLPLSMQIKLLRSEVTELRLDNRELSADRLKLLSSLEESKSELNRLLEDRAQLKKSAAAAESFLEKVKTGAAASKLRENDLEHQVSSLQKQVASLKKANNHSTSANNAVDVRLSKALEEIDRLRNSLAVERTNHGSSSHSQKELIEQLQGSVRKLEKQRTELIIAFKKQLKLIDVLKRQRVHMEAARMLSFTEEEFARIINGAA